MKHFKTLFMTITFFVGHCTYADSVYCESQAQRGYDESECMALWSIYQSLFQDPDKTAINWFDDPQRPIESFHGIRFNQSKRITRLVLHRYAGANGVIPDEIASLSEIETLDLARFTEALIAQVKDQQYNHHNKIQSVSPSINTLGKLRFLSMQGVGLESFPTLTGLENLRSLLLNESHRGHTNNIKMPIHALGLKNLESLQNFNISHNSFYGSLTPEDIVDNFISEISISTGDPLGPGWSQSTLICNGTIFNVTLNCLSPVSQAVQQRAHDVWSINDDIMEEYSHLSLLSQFGFHFDAQKYILPWLGADCSDIPPGNPLESAGSAVVVDDAGKGDAIGENRGDRGRDLGSFSAQDQQRSGGDFVKAKSVGGKPGKPSKSGEPLK